MCFWQHIILNILSVSEQGEQKSSVMRERAIKWDGKQKVIDHIICCEFQIKYVYGVICMLFVP
jgi:predicted transcriptional regulator